MMRLAISNIAWDAEEDQAIANLLNRFDIDAIDIAPSKYFAEPAKAKDHDIAAVKNWWQDHGIEVTGMQSLLFGTTGLNVFGNTEKKHEMLDHLNVICRIGSGLGATRLVFGSPKNRDRSGLSDDEVAEQAMEFFHQLGDIAQSNGVYICLEPNPTQYGANFMTTSAQTAAIVHMVNHSAIQMQFDTGAITINGEDPEDILKNSAAIIKHIHASEPDLVPLGDGKTDHHLMHKALLKYLPNHIVSIEMVATKNEPHSVSIERALSRAIEAYQSHHEDKK